jgi:hypothetical protein
MSDERTEQDNERDRETAAPEREEASRPVHVPDPTAMMGNLDTSGTGGAGGHTELRNLAPIFAVAEARDLAYAARAVDPNDPDVPADHVQLSTGLSVVQGDPEGDRQRVTQRAQEARQRLDGSPLGQNLNDQGEYVDHRQEHAERAWAASVSDMGPATVIGPAELGQVPVAPDSVIDNRPEDERSPEGVPTASAPATEAETPETPPETVSDPEAPVQEQPEPEVVPEPEPEPEVMAAPDEPHAPEGDVKAPNKASSKTEWVEWAVACGASPEEAQEMTRLQLISKYAKLRPNER